MTNHDQFTSLGHVCLFLTPWSAACQASLSFTISQSLLKLLFIELVVTSNHLILCCPPLLLPPIFLRIGVFSNEWAYQVPKILEGFPDSGKESTCNAGDSGSTPGLGRWTGEGKGCPLQYSGLEDSMDCIIHGIAESDRTEQLSLSFSLSSTGASASASSFWWIFWADFLQNWLVWSPCCPRESQESSPAPQLESINSSVFSILYGQTLTFVSDS